MNEMNDNFTIKLKYESNFHVVNLYVIIDIVQ